MTFGEIAIEPERASEVPLILSDVAFVLLQERVAELPAVIEVEEADNVTVGDLESPGFELTVPGEPLVGA